MAGPMVAQAFFYKLVIGVVLRDHKCTLIDTVHDLTSNTVTYIYSAPGARKFRHTLALHDIPGADAMSRLVAVHVTLDLAQETRRA